MGNFWRSLDLSLSNCERELDLKWTKNCVITEVSRTFRAVDPNADPFVYELVTTFQINNAKLCCSYTLAINNNNKFLENKKQGFKITISWIKYRSKITTQPKNNDLDYLIDRTSRNINRLFVLSFKNGDNDPTRDSFETYYMSKVEIKDSNALIENEPIFDQPLKNKQEAYEKLIKMSRNNDYTTRNLSRQTNIRRR